MSTWGSHLFIQTRHFEGVRTRIPLKIFSEYYEPTLENAKTTKPLLSGLKTNTDFKLTWAFASLTLQVAHYAVITISVYSCWQVEASSPPELCNKALHMKLMLTENNYIPRITDYMNRSADYAPRWHDTVLQEISKRQRYGPDPTLTIVRYHLPDTESCTPLPITDGKVLQLSLTVGRTW
jgi:hypothetical protein